MKKIVLVMTLIIGSMTHISQAFAQEGSVESLSGTGMRSLGNPPSDPEMDWVVVVR